MPLAIKSVDNLTPGLKVARDVNIRGMVLLTANTVLTEANIQQLRKWSINSVAILEEGNSENPEQPGVVQSDDSYLQEKARIETLFKPLSDDKQMVFLQDCLLKHLEGR